MEFKDADGEHSVVRHGDAAVMVCRGKVSKDAADFLITNLEQALQGAQRVFVDFYDLETYHSDFRSRGTDLLTRYKTPEVHVCVRSAFVRMGVTVASMVAKSIRSYSTREAFEKVLKQVA